MKKFTAAVIQMDSGNDVDQNLKELERFIEEAAEKNAKLIAMPENVNYVGDESAKYAEDVPGGKTFCFLSELAVKYGVWLHCGSIYEKNPADSRPYNCTMVIGPDGELKAKYHKMHPFDVEIKKWTGSQGIGTDLSGK